MSSKRNSLLVLSFLLDLFIELISQLVGSDCSQLVLSLHYLACHTEMSVLACFDTLIAILTIHLLKDKYRCPYKEDYSKAQEGGTELATLKVASLKMYP